MQSAKLTFEFSQTFGPWQFTTSWPIFNFQSPSFAEKFPYFFCLTYQFLSPFYKYTGRGEFYCWKKRLCIVYLEVFFHIYVCIQLIDISGQRQLKVHRPQNFFIAFVRCLQANFAHCKISKENVILTLKPTQYRVSWFFFPAVKSCQMP